jgi:hypothetical protein|tara:strand:- start:60 stop:431 length:372 start_codon:yes stop_codon:yes gene_type:complete
MLIEKDTKEATSKFFAVADIDARAAAAYAANKQLFNSAQHTTKVELVDSIIKSMFIGYATAYQTSRAATSKRAAHTEVKYFRVITYAAQQHKKLKAAAVEQLAALGLDLVYKPRTDSYSVHVI